MPGALGCMDTSLVGDERRTSTGEMPAKPEMSACGKDHSSLLSSPFTTARDSGGVGRGLRGSYMDNERDTNRGDE